MITDFKGTTAVLTGAGSGFGLECARIGAARGMNLVLVDVQQDALDKAQAEMEAAGAQVLARKVDVAERRRRWKRWPQAVQERFGAPHFVFNNAGVGAGGLVWENTVADWEWVLGVDLWGVVHGVRLFTPMMLEAAAKDPAYRGHIVNTASMAGLLTPPNMGIYNAAKARGGEPDRDALPGPEAGHRPDRRQPAVPVLRAHRHHQQRAQPARRAGRRRSHQEPADRPGDERQGRQQRQGDGGRSGAEGVRRDQRRTSSTSSATPRRWATCKSRMENIVSITNPADPFLARPEIGARLREQLRAG